MINRIVQAFGDRGCTVVVAGPKALRDNAVFRKDQPFSFVELPEIPIFETEGNHAEAAREYTRRLTEAANIYRPDIILTEHFPFLGGIEEKPLIDFLAHVKKASPSTRIYSIPRDIPPTLLHDSAIRIARDYYDGILVRGDRKLFSFQDFFTEDEWKKFGDKVSHLGYLIPSAIPVRSGGGVVVGLGGKFHPGDYSLCMKLMQGFAELPHDLKQKDWRFFVPENCPVSERDALCAKAQELNQQCGAHIHIDKVGPQFPEALASCDLAIARGGITCVEAAAYGKSTLIIPRGVAEQRIRAEAVAKANIGRVKVLREEGLTLDKLAQSLTQLQGGRERFVKRPRLEKALIKPIEIDGHERLADTLIDRFNGIPTSFHASPLSKA